MFARLTSLSTGTQPLDAPGRGFALELVPGLRLSWRLFTFPIIVAIAALGFGGFAVWAIFAERSGPASGDVSLIAIIYMYVRILFVDWVYFLASAISSFLWFRGLSRRPGLLRDLFSAAVPCGDVAAMALALPLRPWAILLFLQLLFDLAVWMFALISNPEILGFGFVPFLLFAFSWGSPLLAFAVASRLLFPSANAFRLLLRAALLIVAFPAGLTFLGISSVALGFDLMRKVPDEYGQVAFGVMLFVVVAIPTILKFIAARLLLRQTRRKLERLYSEGFDEVFEEFAGR